MSLAHLTPEQRADALASARKTVEDLKARVGELKQDWLDDAVWLDLAHERGLRLPVGYLRPTPTLIRRYCRKLKVPIREFLTWGGYKTLEDFERFNPRWPLRALVGVLLEYVEERDGAREQLRDRLIGRE